MKRKTVKTVVGLVVEYGTGVIVAGVVRNNVSPQHVVAKIACVAGSMAIAGVVGTYARRYSDDMVDSAYKFIDDIKNNR